MLKFIPSNIPEELKSEYFMLWRYEERDGRMKKPPLNPHTGVRGDVTDPSQWADYDTARLGRNEPFNSSPQRFTGWRHGALCKLGRKWLVSEEHLFQRLREHGVSAGKPPAPK
mgnify:CR=1 FL=1